MDKNDSKKSRRGIFAVWALLYAIAIIYCSVVVGPSGFNFVPMKIDEAWDRFLKTSYLINGSDQRADWMANLMMLVPMGFLVTGIVGPRRGVVSRGAISLLTLAVCVGFVLAVKFLQLFFPPRTVSLNYITAQSLGCAVGTLAFWLLQSRLFAREKAVDARKAITRLLAVYASVYLIYVLLPLDFTLSADDFHDRLLVVPHYLRSWPGSGQPIAIGLFLVVANVLATVPLGLLLAFRIGDKSPAWYFTVSLVAMSAITFLKIFIIGATPYLAAIVFATTGMLAGVGLVKAAGPNTISTVRAMLLQSLLVLVPLYVLAVLYVNNLLSLQWRTLPEAVEALNSDGLIPFWNWYIVPKAHAAKSLAAHAIMFLPIGIMMSLRRTTKTGAARHAGALAFVFALLVETGRWFRPGLAPDFYEAVVAALAAWLAAKLMPLVWGALEGKTEGQAGGAAAANAKGSRLPGEVIVRQRLGSKT